MASSMTTITAAIHRLREATANPSAMVNRNPSGTRMRRAMRAHPVGGAGTGLVAESVMRLQKLAGCGDDLDRLNGQKSFVRLGAAAMTGHAVRRTKDDAGGSKWSVARRIGRAKDCDNGNPQRGREVHGAGVSANEKLRAP